MTVLTPPVESACYEDLAAFYDLLSPPTDYEFWIEQIEGAALRCGLSGRRVLDVACGSGHSIIPWLARGYTVTGCDGSAAMLSLAAERSDGRATLELVDLRATPVLGAFDLVTCLNDSLNHLLHERDLRAALRGMSANLASGGLIAFDLNTLQTLSSAFSTTWVRESGDRLVLWRGLGSSDLEPGSTTRAQIELLSTSSGGWERRTTQLAERHHPLASIVHELHAAGLEAKAILTQRRGGELVSTPACEEDFKALFLAGRSSGLAAWALAHGHERRPC